MVNPEMIEISLNEGRQIVEKILKARKYSFHNMTPSDLPDKPGIYVISQKESVEILRVGRTDDQTLRDRIYRNHLMGNQQGNLRAQLVKSGICQNMEEAKKWIRDHCEVQFLEKDQIGLDMRWAEHFLLAVLRPKFSN